MSTVSDLYDEYHVGVLVGGEFAVRVVAATTEENWREVLALPPDGLAFVRTFLARRDTESGRRLCSWAVLTSRSWSAADVISPESCENVEKRQRELISNGIKVLRRNLPPE